MNLAGVGPRSRLPLIEHMFVCYGAFRTETPGKQVAHAGSHPRGINGSTRRNVRAWRGADPRAATRGSERVIAARGSLARYAEPVGRDRRRSPRPGWPPSRRGRQSSSVSPLSSRGLGRRPLTAETRVRIPVAVLQHPPVYGGFVVLGVVRQPPRRRARAPKRAGSSSPLTSASAPAIPASATR